jgi:hypothetical protein
VAVNVNAYVPVDILVVFRLKTYESLTNQNSLSGLAFPGEGGMTSFARTTVERSSNAAIMTTSGRATWSVGNR